MTQAHQSTPFTTSPAGSLRPGDRVVEHDGAVLTVASVEPRGSKIHIRFERYGIGPAPETTLRMLAAVRVMAVSL